MEVPKGHHLRQLCGSDRPMLPDLCRSGLGDGDVAIGRMFSQDAGLIRGADFDSRGAEFVGLGSARFASSAG